MRIWNAWKAYWFTPASLFNLAWCRLLLVGLQLYLMGFVRKLSGERWYEFLMYQAHHAPVRVEASFEPPLVYKLLSWSFREPILPSEFFLSTVFVLTVLAGLSAFIGLFTNLSLIVFYGRSCVHAILHLFVWGISSPGCGDDARALDFSSQSLWSCALCR